MMQDPLDEIFTIKISQKEYNDLKEKIKLLENGISNEIDDLSLQIKKLKEENKLLEVRDKDFQRAFDEDRLLFKKQNKEIEGWRAIYLLEKQSIERLVQNILDQNLEAYPRYELLELMNIIQTKRFVNQQEKEQ